MTTPKNNFLKIYYDSTCPMCTTFKRFSEKNTNHQEVEFQSVQSDILPENFSKTDLLSEIYAVDNEGSVVKGSDAIFAVLKRHRWLYWLGHLGTLPGIKESARPVYRAVANQRHFIFGPLSRIFWIRIITIVGLLSGLMLSLPLWIGQRIIPTVPALNLPWIQEVSTILFILLIPSLLWALFSARPAKALFLSVCILMALVIFDQNRLQPWIYNYGAFLILLSTFSWNPKKVLGQQELLNLLSIMLASIYVYSGIQKINPIFFTSVYPWMVEPYLYTDYFLPIILFGLFIPFIEVFIGIGLLFKRTRPLALFGAMMMLAFVLYTLGPLGNNWNVVVWPWNITFALLAILLFWRNQQSALQILKIPRTILSYVCLILFTVFPILFFFNLWDSYPSFSLYSGQTASLNIILPADLELPIGFESYTMQNTRGDIYLNLTALAMNDIHTPVYPETRVQRVVAKEICKILHEDTRIIIEFIPRLYWISWPEITQHRCADLNTHNYTN